MNDTPRLPSYEEIFGSLDFKKGDDGRSVLSPAAYLVDLLQLLDDRLKVPDTSDGSKGLHQRRSDIKHLPLNTENTFTPIPYLDIVNNILEQKVKGNGQAEAYAVLKEVQYPLNYPFNFENERIKKFLNYLNISSEELYKLFSLKLDAVLIGREYLGLSQEEFDAILKDPSPAELQTYLKITQNSKKEQLSKSKVADFLAATRLSGAELRELLYQNLSEAAKSNDVAALAERTKASDLFINYNLKGYAVLDQEEVNIVWNLEGKTNEEISDQWFIRVQKLIRLQKKINLSFTELDLILRTCCQSDSGQGVLDGTVIQNMAAIKSLGDRYKIPVDVVCSFLRPINVLGIGDGPEPQDLFNRIFNLKFAPFDKKYIPGSVFVPASYANYAPLTCDDDILAPKNKEFRTRVGQALDMSDAQLVMVVNKFRSQAKRVGQRASSFDENAAIGLPALSLLFRLSQLVEILDLSYEDLFNLFDILGKDPAIRLFSHFNTLIPVTPLTQDCYRIIAGDDIAASLWLVQMLGAISQWLQTNDLSTSELKQWLTGVYSDQSETAAAQKQKLEFLNSLYQQFKPLFFTAENLASEADSDAELLNPRMARIIHQTFLANDSGLVASQDNRLVKYDHPLTEKAAYQALVQLHHISPEDFTGLGLGDKILDKIFNNLILKGYITAEGFLQEDQFPTAIERFQLETDFSAHREDVFTIIHDLLREAMAVENAVASGTMEMEDEDEFEDDSDPDEIDAGLGMELDDEDDEIDGSLDEEPTAVDLSIYPSDLEGLTVLSESDRKELYETLVFNGYIDEEGKVLQTRFFAEPDNGDNFQLNTSLASYSGQVFKLILAQIQQFQQAELRLDSDTFSELPIKAFEIDDLLENLRFNGYIDSEYRLLNKAALLTTTLDSFNLSLAFYPHRRRILRAIQGLVQQFKSDFYTLGRDLFADISDTIAAHQVYQKLEPDYRRNNLLKGQMLEDEGENFFLDSDNLSRFSLGAPFTENDMGIIFGAIQRLITTAKKYQFDPQILEALDFDWDEQEELIDILGSMDVLKDSIYLTQEKISYFLEIDHSLEFTLPGFEDYNKDVFFALHEIARVIDTDVQAIATRFQALAESQTNALLESLQDHLGVDADIIQTLGRQVWQNPESLVEVFLGPVLKAVNNKDEIAVEPDNNTFNFAYRRIKQFAAIAAKLGLNQRETEILWQDQNLVEKFPEKLALPLGVDRIDALLEAQLANGRGVIYLFAGNQFWRYSADNYTLLPPEGKPLEPAQGQPLTALSDLFAGVQKVDAAFADLRGGWWLISQGITYYKARGSDRWVQLDAPQPEPQPGAPMAQSAKIWGKVVNNFEDPQRIDTTVQDRDGRVYLFSGDQYIRYSSDDYTTVDEGYPLKVEHFWQRDALGANSDGKTSTPQPVKLELPEAYQTSIDASFQDVNGVTYLFKDNGYLTLTPFAPEQPINQTWGKVRNNFEALGKIDAAYGDGHQIFIFSGDQVVAYQDSLENSQVTILEGYPKRLRNHYHNLPVDFVDGVEAAFKAKDGSVHLFKGGTVLTYKSDLKSFEESSVKTAWGQVRNSFTAKNGGEVDAAFVGLDGKTYLFSDDQYVRYSGADYTHVDDGFPRTIEQDWGGLSRVQDAFVLDGKTYLFGQEKDNTKVVYVRYSTRDYTKQDEGYPKSPRDNWWNLPLNLIAEDADFATIDAVFNAPDNKIYLFADDKFIYFDQQQRWWSEPQELAKTWSLPFRTKRVNAAFAGKDGKTYLFAGKEFVKYSGQDYSRTDDRQPSKTNRYWGYTRNNIDKTGRVDAALVVELQEKDTTDEEKSTVYTYLFSGHQYFRYIIPDKAKPDKIKLDEGYPKTIASSLPQEPHFKNIEASTLALIQDGIDAVFADRRQIYLFKNGQCHVVSDTLYKSYDTPGLADVSCAFMAEGTIFLANGAGWHRHSSLEAPVAHATPWQPPCLRGVLDDFKSGLDAVLHGRDRNTYLFKGSLCFNESLNRAYPLGEEWGRVNNNIDSHNTVDAAFVGRDGKTYLFSGDQFVVYAAKSKTRKAYTYGDIEQLPRTIKDYWGGLTRVSLAFVKDEKTYLFEPADALGNARYICYSTADYSQPDAGFPKVGDRSFWQIPLDYLDEDFETINAVLFEGENMFLISGQRYIQYDADPGQWTYPKPLARIWRDIPFNRDTFDSIKTAFTGLDGKTYFFAENYYVGYEKQAFQPPALINQRWGKVKNNFTDHPQGNRVDAAFVYQNQITYLFSGDQYIRYSSPDYRYVDEGYPKTIAGQLRLEAGFQNLPASFEADILAIQANTKGVVISAVLANDRTIYLLMGDRWHAVSQRLTATYPLSRLGRLKNNIAQHNRVDAALFLEATGQTFLFSGDQGVRYSDSTYALVDDGYPQSLATILTEELGLPHLDDRFHYGIDAVLKVGDGPVYVFKDKDYQRSGENNAKSIAGFWGKILNNFLPTNGTKVSLDAAFISPKGHLYAFKGKQYVRYTSPDQEYVDEGFPKLIKDNWGNLPLEFEESISGGFVFEGKTYLLKHDATQENLQYYVRYSNATYQLIDAIYPQPIKFRWGDWSDYLLNDLYLITRFKQLQDNYGHGEQSLLDFLHPETGAVADPYAMLAELFGWDGDDVKWLKRKNAFLRDETLFEIQFNLEIIIRLFDIFSLAQKMGMAPRELYDKVWLKRYTADASAVNLQAVADTLYRCLALKHSA